MCHVTYLVVFAILVLSKLETVIGVSIQQDLAMTVSQKHTLDRFRQNVAPLLYRDFMKHDIFLIRWLRARDFNLQAAENMLHSHINWRKSMKIDTILEEDWSDMRKEFHATIDTYDKEGRPIGVIDIGDWDIRVCALQGKGPRLVHYLDYLLENITQQVFERQLQGMNVTQWKLLGNGDGFNVVQHTCPLCLPLWIQVIQGLESNYPGWLDELIVINAPQTYGILLQAVGPFINRNTRQSIKIFGTEKQKWMEYMDQRIDRTERRPQYGGVKPSIFD